MLQTTKTHILFKFEKNLKTLSVISKNVFSQKWSLRKKYHQLGQIVLDVM